jgi:hypothetical protein
LKVFKTKLFGTGTDPFQSNLNPDYSLKFIDRIFSENEDEAKPAL